MKALAVLWIIVGTLASIALFAHLVVQLWSWFVVPLGAPPVGYIHAFGLVYTYRALTRSYSYEKFRYGQENLERARKQRGVSDLQAVATEAVYRILSYALLLGFGWVVHYAMQAYGY